MLFAFFIQHSVIIVLVKKNYTAFKTHTHTHTFFSWTTVGSIVCISIVQNLSQHTNRWHAVLSMWCTWLICHSYKNIVHKTFIKTGTKLWNIVCTAGARYAEGSGLDLTKIGHVYVLFQCRFCKLCYSYSYWSQVASQWLVVCCESPHSD